MRAAVATLGLALGCALAPRLAPAQEFAAPAPAAEPGVAALLERGLAGPEGGLEAAALTIRWHGVPELATRAAAVGASWGVGRFAAGVAATGDAELGWDAAAAAVGAVAERGAVALRACGRRRRDGRGEWRATHGLEAGAGAWIAAAPGVVAWMSAPQAWSTGDSPPLERWLEVGAAADVADTRMWLVRAVAPGAPRGLRAEHLAGFGAPFGPLAVWIEVRDHPARGGLGLAARSGKLKVGVVVESHPVLDETVRLALSWSARSWW